MTVGHLHQVDDLAFDGSHVAVDNMPQIQPLQLTVRAL